MSNGFVVALGLGIVFLGLICIIIVCSIMSAVVRCFEKGKKQEPKASVQTVSNTQIADRDKVVVAISAAIAEELGESTGAIRIKSLRRI